MILNYKKLTSEQLDNINHAREIYCIDDIANERLKKKADKFVCKAVLDKRDPIYGKPNKNHELLSKIFVDYFISDLYGPTKTKVVNYLYNNVIFGNNRKENLSLLLTILDGKTPELENAENNAEKIKLIERTYINLLANNGVTEFYNGKKLEEINDRIVTY